MAVFNPELAARMKMPKELLDQASGLHFVMHFSERFVEAALFEASGTRCLWHVNTELPIGNAVDFVYQRNWHEQVFRKCTVSFDTLIYTAVPLAYYDSEQNSSYLKLQHGSLNASTSSIELAELDAVVCFEIPAWQGRLMSFIPNARIMPVAALLARYMRSIAPRQGQAIGLWVNENNMTLCCLNDRNLTLLMSNAVTAEEDVLYHLSNAAMRLELDLEHTNLELIHGNGFRALKSTLDKYIRKVNTPAVDKIVNEGSFMPQMHILCV